MDQALANLVTAQEALDAAIAAVQEAASSEVSTEPQWATDVSQALVNDGWTAPTPSSSDTDQA